MSYCYEYPRPAVATDCVVFRVERAAVQLLLIERRHDPFQGCWALPGGFLEMDEDLGCGARRELEEETGLQRVEMEQLGTFGTVDRDPRARVISVVYMALIPANGSDVKAGDDAAQAQWFDVKSLPSLAFDHREIVDCGWQRLKDNARRKPIGLTCLPGSFACDDLRQLYAAILEQPIDPMSFDTAMRQSGLLVKQDGSDVANVDQLRFDQDVYQQMQRDGLGFDVTELGRP